MAITDQQIDKLAKAIASAIINPSIVQSKDVRNPYKQFDFTIPNGEVFTIYYTFDFWRMLSLSNTSGVRLRFGNTGSFTDIVGAGIGNRLPEPVGAIQIENNSGGVLTGIIGLAVGDIFDDRLNVSGNINVVNAAGTCLAVKNCTNEPLLETNDAAVLAMLQNDTALRAPLTTLSGATFAQVSNTTTEIVSAAANTNGIIVRIASITTGTGTASFAYLTSGGASNYIFGGSNSSSQYVTNIFIPAGQNLSASTSAAGSQMNVWYEVL